MKIDYFPTLRQLVLFRRYPNEDGALELLWNRLYGNLVMTCPKCGEEDAKFYRISGRSSLSHGGCGWHISPRAGTIFEHSPTPLTLWFEAIYLIYTSDGQIPALELKRKLGVTYKTAWRMKRLICDYLHLDRSYSYKFSSAEKPIPPRRKQKSPR